MTTLTRRWSSACERSSICNPVLVKKRPRISQITQIRGFVDHTTCAWNTAEICSGWTADTTPKAFYNTAQGRAAHPGFANGQSHKPRRGFINENQAMPQSLVQIYVHIVYATKHRRPFLKDKEFRDRTHRYLAGICKNLKCPALVVGGVEDHVHLLYRLGKTVDTAALIRDLKRDSSKWVKSEQPQLADFHWQMGYGAFSISPSHVEALKRYIASQEEHHRYETFRDEFRRLCKKYGLEIDERYAWD
jgi:putative transposase